MFAETGDNVKYGNNPTTTNGSILEEKQQPPACRDPIFAVLFYVNLAIIIGIAAVFGVSPFVDPADGANDDAQNATIDYTPFIYTAGLCGGIGLVLSCLALNVLMCIPGILIKVALIGNLVLSLGMAFAALYYGSTGVAIVCFIGFAFCACYTYCIWSRIPFATVSSKIFFGHWRSCFILLKSEGLTQQIWFIHSFLILLTYLNIMCFFCSFFFNLSLPCIYIFTILRQIQILFRLT